MVVNRNMTAHDPSMARGGWMRWLGLGGDRREALGAALPADVPSEGVTDSPSDMPGDTHAFDGGERLEMLAEISQFIVENDLPVTPFTLEAAHDIITGANPALAEFTATRLAEGDPITVAWLENVRCSGVQDSATARLHSLIARLEATIDAFAITACAAKTATSDYNTALEAHVDDLAAIDGSDDVVAQITTLARDMLDRTREVARELSRSERETHALQRQLADARAEAEVDHLTGLPNRRAFEARYDLEYTATREAGESLCVAFCDIDEFKRINDKHGHEAGDRVLRTVAQSLATISDDTCHVARHGGEEFVVLLRNKLLAEACAVIDEAREAIASRRLVNRTTDVPFGQITLSAGVADVHAYDDARAALRAADGALLRAKEAGRNVVLKAEPSD